MIKFLAAAGVGASLVFNLIPTILALRIITGVIALGMFTAWCASKFAGGQSLGDRMNAAGWGLMCLAVLFFSTQFFSAEIWRLPLDHWARQGQLFLAIFTMWGSFQFARGAALLKRGKSVDDMKADQITTIAIGLVVIALCNFAARII